MCLMPKKQPTEERERAKADVGSIGPGKGKPRTNGTLHNNTTAMDPEGSGHDDDGVDGGRVAGYVVGCVLGVALLAVFAAYYQHYHGDEVHATATLQEIHADNCALYAPMSVAGAEQTYHENMPSPIDAGTFDMPSEVENKAAPIDDGDYDMPAGFENNALPAYDTYQRSSGGKSTASPMDDGTYVLVCAGASTPAYNSTAVVPHAQYAPMSVAGGDKPYHENMAVTYAVPMESGGQAISNAPNTPIDDGTYEMPSVVENKAAPIDDGEYDMPTVFVNTDTNRVKRLSQDVFDGFGNDASTL